MAANAVETPEARPKLPRWLLAMPIAGASLAAAVAAFLGWMLVAGTGQFVPLAATLGGLLTAGKEGAIPVGLALDGHPLLVGGTLLVADIALTLLLYPVVLAGLQGAERRPGILGRMLRNASHRADRHRAFVDRYGVAGLFAFLLVPFAFNGPIVGAVLGRLAGLTPLQSLTTVLAAIATTTVAWTSLYAYGFQEMGIDPRIPMVISISIAAVTVGLSLVAALREREPQPVPSEA